MMGRKERVSATTALVLVALVARVVAAQPATGASKWIESVQAAYDRLHEIAERRARQQVPPESQQLLKALREQLDSLADSAMSALAESSDSLLGARFKENVRRLTHSIVFEQEVLGCTASDTGATVSVLVRRAIKDFCNRTRWALADVQQDILSAEFRDLIGERHSAMKSAVARAADSLEIARLHGLLESLKAEHGANFSVIEQRIASAASRMDSVERQAERLEVAHRALIVKARSLDTSISRAIERLERERGRALPKSDTSGGRTTPASPSIVGYGLARGPGLAPGIGLSSDLGTAGVMLLLTESAARGSAWGALAILPFPTRSLRPLVGVESHSLRGSRSSGFTAGIQFRVRHVYAILTGARGTRVTVGLGFAPGALRADRDSHE